ncbi:MAG: hypothetical protein NTX05_07600 [Fusobacteria bacterium]|nr:hypothetical protein [Fusobacteriota bacterium]
MLIKSLINDNHQDDSHYITVEIINYEKKRLEINLDTNKNVVTHDRSGELESIMDIRNGSENKWLISGGVLLFNHKLELAVGLRDGNSVEPFSYTNIASGRCDRDLIEHCFEELESEMVLFIKEKAWKFVKIGSQELCKLHFKKGDVLKKYKKIMEITTEVVSIDAYKEFSEILIPLEEIAFFRDGVYQYSFKAFLFIDSENKTIEYRLPMKLNFSKVEEVAIFYNEGTGYGKFKSLRNLQALIDVEKAWGESLVVPMIKELIKQMRKV